LRNQNADDPRNDGLASGSLLAPRASAPPRAANGIAMVDPQQFEAAAEPSAPSVQAEAFYASALRDLAGSGPAFLVGGTYAVSAYTGVTRATKDLDLFCRPGDHLRILARFQDLGYRVEIEDDRWLGKVRAAEDFFDLIFASWDGSFPVSEEWFEPAPQIELFGTKVRLVAPTELVWSKALVQRRDRYDGADIATIILKQHARIDWRRLLGYMDLHWEVLLMHLLNFRWAFPSERDAVPRWLMDELLARARLQLELPPPQTRICRGRMLSRIDYEPAVRDWGFADPDGNMEWKT
jgi:hypothetical protein